MCSQSALLGASFVLLPWAAAAPQPPPACVLRRHHRCLWQRDGWQQPGLCPQSAGSACSVFQSAKSPQPPPWSATATIAGIKAAPAPSGLWALQKILCLLLQSLQSCHSIIPWRLLSSVLALAVGSVTLTVLLDPAICSSSPLRTLSHLR